MKIFSCGSQGLLPSIPCVLPTCCSVQNELTFSGIAGSVPGILPLGAGYTTQQNAVQTAAQTSAASSIFPLTAQTSASNPVAAEDTTSAAATTAPSSASVQAAQGGNTAELFVQPQPGFMGSGASLADATEPAVQDEPLSLAARAVTEPTDNSQTDSESTPGFMGSGASLADATEPAVQSEPLSLAARAVTEPTDNSQTDFESAPGFTGSGTSLADATEPAVQDEPLSLAARAVTEPTDNSQTDSESAPGFMGSGTSLADATEPAVQDEPLSLAARAVTEPTDNSQTDSESTPGFMGSGASLADATEPTVQDQSQPLALMEDTTEKSASPSMTYEDAPERTAKSAEDALASKMRSSAAQFLLHSSQAQNAGILPLQPQIISGDDIRFDQGKVLFTAAGLYFVAISLKADADKDSFVELIPQIAGALRQEYAAYSATVAGETGLAASFLLNTTNDKLPVSLELVLHTSATAPVHLEGCLSAFKVGVPENSLLDAAL